MSSVPVTFRTKYDINSSTHYIGVIGSVILLGRWNPQHCLQLTQESQGNWRGSADLPVGQEFEWKLVLLEKSSRNVLEILRWEERDNRKITLNDSSDVVDIMVPWCTSEVVTYTIRCTTLSSRETSGNKNIGHRDKIAAHNRNNYHEDELTTKLPKLKTNVANNYFFKNTVDGMMPLLKRKNAIRRKKIPRADENVNPPKTNEVSSSYTTDNTKKSVAFPRIVVTDVITYDLDNEQPKIDNKQTQSIDNFYFDYCPAEENTTVRFTENKTAKPTDGLKTGDTECSANPKIEGTTEKYSDNRLSKTNTLIDDQTHVKTEHGAGQIARDILDRDQIRADVVERVNDHEDKLKKAFVYGTAVTILAASWFACYKYLS